MAITVPTHCADGLQHPSPKTFRSGNHNRKSRGGTETQCTDANSACHAAIAPAIYPSPHACPTPLQELLRSQQLGVLARPTQPQPMIRYSAVLLLAAVNLAAQVSLTHLGTVDLAVTANSSNPEFIGSNPSAVAWDGNNLWIAGFNNTNATADVAIVKISDALTAPSFGVPFGLQSTNMSRGYSGLDTDGVVLAAAYDNGYSTPDGITSWLVTGQALWSKMGWGGSGVALDPGFAGAGQGIAWTYFGSGRRLLQDTFAGFDIYTPTTGMFISAGIGAFWRDMDFDSQTGDLYLRKGNQVIWVPRLGANTTAIAEVLVPSFQADFVPIQNLAFIRQDEQLLIWNDRPNTSPGKPFANVVQAARTSDGAALAIDFGGFAAPSGSGAYDFSYDEATATLAICDFSNRAVYLFAVTAFLAFGSGCPGSGGIEPTLRATGDARPGGAIQLELDDVAPQSIGLFVFGNSQTSVVLPPPFSPSCALLVSPAAVIAGVFVTGTGGPGSGQGSMTLPLPLGASGVVVTCQGAVLESAALASTRTSNGVQVTLQ